jgi:protein-arginine kinase activator protein McsA
MKYSMMFFFLYNKAMFYIFGCVSYCVTVVSEALWSKMHNCRQCYNFFSHILLSIVETVVGKTKSYFVVPVVAVEAAVAVAADCS